MSSITALSIYDHIERTEKYCTFYKKQAHFTYYARDNQATDSLNREADSWATKIANRIYPEETYRNYNWSNDYDAEI